MPLINSTARLASCLLAACVVSALPQGAVAQSFLSVNDWDYVDLRRGGDADGEQLILTTANFQTITSAPKHGTLANLDDSASLRLAEHSTSVIPLSVVDWFRSHRGRLELERGRNDEDFVRANLAVFQGKLPSGIGDRPDEVFAEYRAMSSKIAHSSAVDWFDCANDQMANFRQFSGHGSDRLRWSQNGGYQENSLWLMDDPARFFSTPEEGSPQAAVLDAVCEHPVMQASYYAISRTDPEVAVPRDAQRWLRRISYPIRAMRTGDEGVTGIQFRVTAEGRAVQCVVTSSSGSPMLDESACSQIERYARFEPREDALDTPLQTFSTAMRWVLPDDPVEPVEESQS